MKLEREEIVFAALAAVGYFVTPVLVALVCAVPAWLIVSRIKHDRSSSSALSVKQH